jgi:protein-L-isoaspartate(D-aspartate) O-methyltransferase
VSARPPRRGEPAEADRSGTVDRERIAERERERMVIRDVIGRGVKDERVIAALRSVPRHRFVDEALAARAHADQPLPIGAGQTISRPSTVALMSELLAPEPGHRVLEIGTGSGYQAAILSRLCARVDTIERVAVLARRAKALLPRLGFANVRVFETDGTRGLKGMKPYPRIIVTAGAPIVPEALLLQLQDGGRLVVPVGGVSVEERLQVIEKIDGRAVTRESVPCSFVPLIGAHGHAPPEPPRWP